MRTLFQAKIKLESHINDGVLSCLNVRNFFYGLQEIFLKPLFRPIIAEVVMTQYGHQKIRLN